MTFRSQVREEDVADHTENEMLEKPQALWEDVVLWRLEQQTGGRYPEGSLNWPAKGLSLSRQSFVTFATCSFFKGGGGGDGRRERNVYIGICNMEFIDIFDKTSFHEVVLGKEACVEGTSSMK